MSFALEAQSWSFARCRHSFDVFDALQIAQNLRIAVYAHRIRDEGGWLSSQMISDANADCSDFKKSTNQRLIFELSGEFKNFASLALMHLMRTDRPTAAELVTPTDSKIDESLFAWI